MSIFNEASVLSTPTIMRRCFHPDSIPSTQTNRLSAHICPLKPVILPVGPSSLVLPVLSCHHRLAKRNGSGRAKREIHRAGTTNGHNERFRKEHESRAKDAILRKSLSIQLECANLSRWSTHSPSRKTLIVRDQHTILVCAVSFDANLTSDNKPNIPSHISGCSVPRVDAKCESL